jgi:hypothetical protein
MTEATSESVRSDCSPAGDGGTAPGGVAGHDTAMTLWSPVRWWGVPLLRFEFFVVRHTGLTLPMLRKLSFIDYARWSLVKEFPRVGAPQGKDPRRRHHMMFESNFNGTWDQYIDTFAEVMPLQIIGFWGSSIKFPGPRRTGPLLAWVRRHHFDVQYFDSAVEDATATVVTSALELEKKLRAFARRSEGLEAEAFQEAYRTLLFQVERDL